MRTGWRRRLLRRAPLMAGSLVAAGLFWFLVNVREKVEVGYMAPLVYEGFPERYLLDGASLETVYVRLRGSRQAVDAVEPQQLRVRVDLRSVRAGNNVVQLAPTMIDVPGGVVVVEISPPAVNLRFMARPREEKGRNR